MRDPADLVAGLPELPQQALARVTRQVQDWSVEPWTIDFFAAMRRLEALAAPAPRWGEAALPSAEALRVGEAPSLAFAPASVAAFESSARGVPVPRLRQYFFGYLGPNGPLPIHLSDLIRDRVRNQGDGTWLAFLDSFGHRFALHFYRAWTQPRPAVALDRPGDEAWRRWIGAFVGIGTPARRQRNAVFDDARLHFSGWLARRVHCNEGIEAVIGRYFDAPARLESWVGHWLPIARDERTYLGGNRMGQGRPGADAAQRLGGGAVLGRQVWDRQHRVRLRLGPLSLARYRQFLPTGSALPALGDWMRQLLGDELQWDSELVLKKQEVPPSRLGQTAGNAPRLGWVCWLGERARTRDAADVRVSAIVRTFAAGVPAALDSAPADSSSLAEEFAP
ncbi:type VI secretion system baseplate subunit TssG [Ottowia pentelensis]|uniref:Type VI secretion system baseplate subunit TssG n=1 Tax=Ottowia pentelensis TaxID=511108 RepID=A0ABV6PN12_9BURK